MTLPRVWGTEHTKNHPGPMLPPCHPLRSCASVLPRRTKVEDMEKSMKAIIFSIADKSLSGYAWRWRSEDRSRDSPSFRYYADCVTDAKKHGCTAQLGVIEPHTGSEGNTLKVPRPNA